MNSRHAPLVGVLLLGAISALAEVDDLWLATSNDGAPSARGHHSAVWTGSQMVVWGGAENFSTLVDTGAMYDPQSESWTPMTAFDAPSARLDHSTVWTGAEMIVWGGGPTATQSGGCFDPIQNQWTPTATSGAPSARYYHSAVWTGSEMIIWGGWNGGAYVGDGARYNPTSNTWTSMSTDDAPAARGRHSAVWTGTEMIIWGGYATDGMGGESYFSNGFSYDPLSDSWAAISTGSAPPGRREHSAVWTGAEMIVWGGYYDGSNLHTGGRYDPATDTWKATSTSAVPTGRQDHVALWTGSEMIIWGGFRGPGTYCSTGARYRPEANRWKATDQSSAPAARRWHSGVWTGREMVVWGGRFQDYSGGEWLDSGSRYTPGDWWPTAGFPFYDSFEQSELADRWEQVTIGGGRLNLSGNEPHSGMQGIILDESSGYASSSAELILHVDLSEQDDVVLDLWWHEIEDSMYLWDGVMVSDDSGENWIQAISFAGEVMSYQNDTVDLDQFASDNGLNLNDHMQIRFRFYDNNYSIAQGGFAIDDVALRSSSPPSLTVQCANGGSVTSDPPGIDCPADCAETYSHFVAVSLTATPLEGFVFTGWSGDTDCGDGELTMLAPSSCVAGFEPLGSEVFSDDFELGDTTAWQ